MSTALELECCLGSFDSLAALKSPNGNELNANGIFISLVRGRAGKRLPTIISGNVGKWWLKWDLFGNFVAECLDLYRDSGKDSFR